MMDMRAIRDFFSDFPETEDENVQEWIKNASPFINYMATTGDSLLNEIERMEKFMKEHKEDVEKWSKSWTNTLTLLKKIRGQEWKKDES